MTAVQPPPGYRSGFCDSGRHDRCRGAYGTTSAPAVCDCACGHRPVEPAPEPERPPGPYLRLSRAAEALTAAPDRLPAPAGNALAALLRAQAAWAADRHDTYPADRVPLLHLADLINGGSR